MDGPDGDQPTTCPIGREQERRAIDRLLESARRGESGSLVVRGEPGIGKTALLEYAAARAVAMTVLRITGVEAESGLAFAGLYGLLRPILGGLDRLVEAQARALEGALGLSPSREPDRFLVSAAVLSLLAAAAEDEPVVCLVDDAHWLDLPSSGALAFAARRLYADRVAMLFAARESEGRFDAHDLPELWLAGIDERSAAQLLASHPGPVAPRVRVRLLAEAAGNPLGLRELPAALTDAQLAGHDPLPESIPLTPRLQRVFSQQIERLPAAARVALLICAADNTGDAATILRAVAELELPGDALDPAERSGLIRTEHGQVTLRHPLVRSAIYDLAAVSERQRVHAVLAHVLSGDDSVDRRVWHQAMATVERDEEVAAALEASARRAQKRAGHASAAAAFERAAELTPDDERRTQRLASAAQAAWDAGQAEHARGLIARVLPSARGMLCARLLYLRGVIEARCGDKSAAVRTFIEGVEASSDPSLTLEMLHEGTDAALDIGDRTSVREFGARAAKLPSGDVRDEFSRSAVIDVAALLAGEFTRAHAHFDDALKLFGEFDDPRAHIWAARAASLGIDLGAGLPFATRAVELARRRGVLSQLPIALQQQAAELFRNSDFDRAYAAAAEGYELSLELGQSSGWHLLTMFRVDAIRGRETEARERFEQLLALAQRNQEAILATVARAVSGLLELTLGRPDEAATILLELTTERPETVRNYALLPVYTLHPIPDAVEAAMRAGRPTGVIDAPLGRYRAWVVDAPTDARRSLLARCEGLTGQRPPEEAFRESLELAHALAPFERARGELLYGEWLRRERRRTDARAHLRRAAEVFRTLGAVPWEERAEGELRATGETARKREPSTLDQLTPQELKIAELASDGLTNPEIAAQLFLSPRTIEYHLRKVFSKLGIASRTELVRRRASVPSPPTSA